MLMPAPDTEHKSLLDEAEDFLRATLAAGPERATTIQKEARELGIAHATLRRAKQRLGVMSRKHGAGEWKWERAVVKRGAVASGSEAVVSGQWSVASEAEAMAGENSNQQRATGGRYETASGSTENWELRTENETAVASGQWPAKQRQ
jgi:hypothetical protein